MKLPSGWKYRIVEFTHGHRKHDDILDDRGKLSGLGRNHGQLKATENKWVVR